MATRKKKATKETPAQAAKADSHDATAQKLAPFGEKHAKSVVEQEVKTASEAIGAARAQEGLSPKAAGHLDDASKHLAAGDHDRADDALARAMGDPNLATKSKHVDAVGQAQGAMSNVHDAVAKQKAFKAIAAGGDKARDEHGRFAPK